jgi:hypothetical protein
MKIKYNFGLLKQLNVGFSSEDKSKRFHGILLDVKKLKDKYKFIFKNHYIEIDALIFSNCKIEKENDVYWFVCQSRPTCSGLFLFTMYDTYGFPLELSEEECEMNDIYPDSNGFLLMRELQKNKSKNTFKNKNAF